MLWLLNASCLLTSPLFGFIIRRGKGTFGVSNFGGEDGIVVQFDVI